MQKPLNMASVTAINSLLLIPYSNKLKLFDFLAIKV